MHRINLPTSQGLDATADMPSHKRSKRSTAFNFQDTTTAIKDIYGGDLFHAHTAPLARRSLFWNNAVHVQKLGTDDNPIICPGNRDTIGSYLHYVYYGTIPCIRDEEVDEEGNTIESTGDEDAKKEATSEVGIQDEADGLAQVIRDEKEWEDLCELYIFAWKVQDEDAMDTTIDNMLDKYNEAGESGSLPAEEAIKNVYSDMESGSPLRRLLVDMYLWEGATPEESDDELHEFVLDLVKASFKRRKEAGKGCMPAHVKNCHYHVHGVKGQCNDQVTVKE